jgi:cytochrome c oxidase cbb3-type subunit 3
MRRVTVVLAFAAVAGAAWLVNPPEGTAAESAAKVFAAKCAGCHGADGSGNIAGAPDFKSAEWHASRTDADLAASIKNGKGRLMPAWGAKLTDAQIGELVAHVRSLKK